MYLDKVEFRAVFRVTDEALFCQFTTARSQFSSNHQLHV